MLDNDYLNRLPKNQLLAANKICTDFLADKVKEDPGDVVHLLEVLLEDRLPEGWDADLDSVVAQTVTFFRTETPGSRSRARISLIHRHVKALAAKATITEPCLINTFLIELSEGERKKSSDHFAQARNKLRDCEIAEEAKQKLTRLILVLQAEVDNKYSDFRVFLDCFVEAAESAGELGPAAKPVFDRIKGGFSILDKVRKERETRETPQAPVALPAPG